MCCPIHENAFDLQCLEFPRGGPMQYSILRCWHVKSAVLNKQTMWKSFILGTLYWVRDELVLDSLPWAHCVSASWTSGCIACFWVFRCTGDFANSWKGRTHPQHDIWQHNWSDNQWWHLEGRWNCGYIFVCLHEYKQVLNNVILPNVLCKMQPLLQVGAALYSSGAPSSWTELVTQDVYNQNPAQYCWLMVCSTGVSVITWVYQEVHLMNKTSQLGRAINIPVGCHKTEQNLKLMFGFCLRTILWFFAKW